MGLSALLKAKVPVLVLSSEQNPVVKHRCDKIGVQSIQTKGSKDKVLHQWAQEHNIDLEHVVYIGNDINDLAAFDVVGCALAVMDAHPTVLQRANHIIPSLGGHGAVRKVCDALLSKRSL
jgi:N-acylneuraminate cytidylyltransferase